MANPRKATAVAPIVSSPSAPADDDTPSGEVNLLGASQLRALAAVHAPSMPAWWTNAYMARSGHNVIDAKAMAEWACEYADALMVELAK